jgi:hypothetical protein
MASKILGGIGSIFGIGGKKKAAAATPTAEAASGPIIKSLNPTQEQIKKIGLKKLVGGNVGAPTILSDKLGN